MFTSCYCRCAASEWVRRYHPIWSEEQAGLIHQLLLQRRAMTTRPSRGSFRSIQTETRRLGGWYSTRRVRDSHPSTHRNDRPNHHSPPPSIRAPQLTRPPTHVPIPYHHYRHRRSIQAFQVNSGVEDLAVGDKEEFEAIVEMLAASSTGFNTAALGRLLEMVGPDAAGTLASLPSATDVEAAPAGAAGTGVNAARAIS